MIDTAKLVTALWSLFIDQVKTGDPVFFCFHSELVAEALGGCGIAARSPVDAIAIAASQFYIIEERHVWLRKAALLPIADSFSPVIILVCQQVLAVEEMVRDSRGFSEHAYFPRLRALISKDLQNFAANPFSFEQFKSIWQRLESEIVSIPGSSASSVTFRFREDSGPHKAKSVPLSQALLSQEDLRTLMQRIGASRLRGADAKGAWSLVRRERPYLSRRAQKLLVAAYLRERLIEQVQRFAQKYDPTRAQAASEKTRQAQAWELRIYREATDWFSEEEFRPLLYSIEARELVGDESAIAMELAKALRYGEALFFVLEDSQSYWKLCNGEARIAPGDPFLIIGGAAEIDRACQELRRLSGDSTLEHLDRKCLGGSSSVLVCEMRLSQAASRELLTRAGRLALGNVKTANPEYEWIGGICLDRRAHKYLREALPTAVRFGGEEYPISELIQVGDHFLSYAAFRRSLDSLTEDNQYDLTYSNGRVARLVVAVVPGTPAVRKGYVMGESGVLSATLGDVGDSKRALVGFSEPEPCPEPRFHLSTITDLIQQLVESKGKSPAPELKALLRRQLRVAAVPLAVKKAVQSLLSRS